MRNDRFFRHPLLSFAELRYSVESDAAYKPHMHEGLSIGAIDKGKVIYNVNGQEASLSPGSLVLMNPEVLHTCNPWPENKRSYYMIHLDKQWCRQVQQSMWEVDHFVRVEKIRIDDIQLYEQFCTAMECLMDDKTHLQEKEQMLFDIVCDIFSIACSPRQVKTQSQRYIETLKELLAADLQKDLPLNMLAKEIDANPYTLIRSFKAETGITPHAYRMNCRIQKARTLLKKGCDIIDTALECGFFDQSHFHRHFKAMTTITPQEYRVNFIQ